jgi:hypothetical protein
MRKFLTAGPVAARASAATRRRRQLHSSWRLLRTSSGNIVCPRCRNLAAQIAQFGHDDSDCLQG